MKEKFELFVCCLGNGLSVCNKAVEENHDYKQIAHISPRGRVSLYVTRSYIPDAEWNKIQEYAAAARDEFIKNFNKLSELKRYSIMLDELSLSDFLKYANSKELSLSEKVAEMTEIYLNM